MVITGFACVVSNVEIGSTYYFIPLSESHFLNSTSGLDLYQFHYVTLHSCVYKTPIAIGRLLQILYSPRSTATGEKIIALSA